MANIPALSIDMADGFKTCQETATYIRMYVVRYIVHCDFSHLKYHFNTINGRHEV